MVITAPWRSLEMEVDIALCVLDMMEERPEAISFEIRDNCEELQAECLGKLEGLEKAIENSPSGNQHISSLRYSPSAWQRISGGRGED